VTRATLPITIEAMFPAGIADTRCGHTCLRRGLGRLRARECRRLGRLCSLERFHAFEHLVVFFGHSLSFGRCARHVDEQQASVT
jgi:hypothetical protein